MYEIFYVHICIRDLDLLYFENAGMRFCPTACVSVRVRGVAAWAPSSPCQRGFGSSPCPARARVCCAACGCREPRSALRGVNRGSRRERFCFSLESLVRAAAETCVPLRWSQPGLEEGLPPPPNSGSPRSSFSRFLCVFCLLLGITFFLLPIVPRGMQKAVTGACQTTFLWVLLNC